MDRQKELHYDLRFKFLQEVFFKYKQYMNPETNRIEYKQQLTDDLEKEAIAFLNYHEGGIIYPLIVYRKA